jgi:hypothetical protein
VWPLPEGNLKLVVQWTEAGMPERSVVLDGIEIAAAAAKAQQY